MIAHVTRIELVAGGCRWVCSCGAASPITFAASRGAHLGAWAHRVAGSL